MTMKDVQAFRKELLELDVELKRFKREILAGRIEQLERAIHRPTPRSHASTHALLAQSCCQPRAKA
ncbi:MAG: hypothetical protein AMJ65_12905 [Phycisphaerae bacterium SG8_4]|nr:MAG: hypothetical protein AMJ65_12905 [Phycisphaerae bacterium SG8_4]